MQVKSIVECSGEHSAILLMCIKLPPFFKTFILSIFEWLLKTDLTVPLIPIFGFVSRYSGATMVWILNLMNIMLLKKP